MHTWKKLKYIVKNESGSSVCIIFLTLHLSSNQICTNPNAIRQLPGTCTALHTLRSPRIKLPLTESCFCSLFSRYDLNWICVDISDTMKRREEEREEEQVLRRGKVRIERHGDNQGLCEWEGGEGKIKRNQKSELSVPDRQKTRKG